MSYIMLYTDFVFAGVGLLQTKYIFVLLQLLDFVNENGVHGIQKLYFQLNML